MARPQGARFQSHQESDRIEKQRSVLVHIVADHPNKISDLRPLFGSRHVITSALLHGMGRLPQDCDAIIAAAGLRNAEPVKTRGQSAAPPTNSASRKPKPAVFSLPPLELCTITALREASSASSKGDQKNA
jgi:hypothetical protein